MSKPKYVDTLNEFWESVNVALKPCEGYLYLYLIQKHNRNFWENPVKLTILSILHDLKIDKRTFKHAKDRLVELGLIEYTGSKGRFGFADFVVKTDFNGRIFAPIEKPQKGQKSTLSTKNKRDKKAPIESLKRDKKAPIDVSKGYINDPIETVNTGKNVPFDAETPLVINKTIIKEDINKQDLNKEDNAETKVSEPQNENELVGNSDALKNEPIGNPEPLEEFQISNDSETQTFETKADTNQTNSNKIPKGTENKKEKNSAKKEKAASDPEKDPLNAALIAAYCDFCKKMGITASVRGHDAGAVKTTLNPYLRAAAKNYRTEKGWQFGTNEDESALGIFNRTLERYEAWEDFNKKRIQLFQIITDLPNIIHFLTLLNSGKSATLHGSRPSGQAAANASFDRAKFAFIIQDIASVGREAASRVHGQAYIDAALEFQRRNVQAN